MNYSEFPNPYDFANPITNKDLFVGRRAELKEIQYYLDQGMKVTNPMNLAYIGDRASGKTSLLNITEIEAIKLGYCTIRIDLDEGDGNNDLSFFHKLFDSVFYKIVENGAFNGLNSKTYEIYLDLITLGNMPEDSDFLPFLFPIFYSKAIRTDVKVNIPDNSLKKDFEKLKKEIDKPIIILIDECDVLTHNKIILQKLRNIFMNIPGYMLIIAGTRNLFPAIDDVFSPIIRQFKKVKVESFSELIETKDCIVKPLENIGLIVNDIIDLKTLYEVSEIHNLSSGKPYEIQLICHVMFRRVQEGRTSSMKLNLPVLEEVLNELEKFQNINARPLLMKVQKLNKNELLSLGKLCESKDGLTFDQILELENIFNLNNNFDNIKFTNNFSLLEKEGLISKTDGKICFCGDDFDKIYIKYYSREKGVNIVINEVESNLLVFIKTLNFFSKEFNFLKPLGVFHMNRTKIKFESVIEELKNLNSEKDIFAEIPSIAESFYNIMISDTKHSILNFYKINLALTWTDIECYLYSYDDQKINFNNQMFNDFKNRLKMYSDKLEIDYKQTQLILPVILKDKLKKTSNKSLRKKIIMDHFIESFDHYLTKDLEFLQFKLELLDAYIDPLEENSEILNNMGYMMMNSQNIERAEYYLKESLNKNDKSTNSLVEYNLFILKFIKSKIIDIDKLNYLKEQLENTKSNIGIIAILCILVIENEEINVIEKKEIDILDAVNNNINVYFEFTKKTV